MINLWDFENSDIGKLAVHLHEVIRPRPAEYLPIITGTTAFVPFTGRGVFLGLSFTDTDGTAANTVTVRDGAGPDGQVIAEHTVAASSAALVPFPAPGVLITRGLYVVSTAAGTATLYLSRHGWGDTVRA